MGELSNTLYEHYRSKFKGHDGEGERTADRDWFRNVVEAISEQLPEQGSVLDAGCGTGAHMDVLENFGFQRVRGIDLSSEQVSVAREHGLNVECKDVLSSLHGVTERYKLIVAIDFVEHLSKSEMFRFFELSHQALRHGGVLIVRTPNGQGLFSRSIIYGDLTHETVLVPNTARFALRLAGFSDVSVYEVRAFGAGLSAVLRGLVWRIVRLVLYVVLRVVNGKQQRIWTENLLIVATKSPS